MRLTERPLFFWARKRFRGLQVVLLAIFVIGLFFRVYPLEMQRKIINIAINLRMIDKLYLYCGLYLGSVLLAGLLKYASNTLQDVIGQKILIGMRRELYQHILQLPLTFFHRIQIGTITSAMTSELSAIADFLGGALAVPITSFLTFAVFLGFMIYLNPLLGLLSIVIFPFELTIIPLLQHWYNRFNRRRVSVSRQMASLVNEAVEGIHEVQGNGSFLLEQTKLDRLVYRLYDIVFRLAIVKYGIKFSNSLFQSIGPFLLFLVGGYLAIKGEFTIGALVAFLSAYEKVYDPWKEVIDYYQSYQDARVRYQQIMELFDQQPQFLLEAPAIQVPRHGGALTVSSVSYRLNDSVLLLDNVSFELPAGNHLALVGFSGSGKSTLGHIISGLYRQTSGTIEVDGRDLDEISKWDTVATIGTVSQHPFIFTGSVRDNLLYSINALHMADRAVELPGPGEVIEVASEVGLYEDVIRWGLRSTINPRRAEPMIPSFLQMRKVVQQIIRKEVAQAVEFYDASKFLNYSSLAINIMFGSYGVAYKTKKLLKNEQFMSFIKRVGLHRDLIGFGYTVAAETASLLGKFSDDEFLFQGSPMKPYQLAEYQTILTSVAGAANLEALPAREQDRLLLLALRFKPGVHKITTLPPRLITDIMKARTTFLKEIAEIDIERCSNGVLQADIKPLAQAEDAVDTAARFTPFCINQYLYSHTLRDNIIFGTIIDQDLIRDRLGSIIRKELERYDLDKDIFEIGLDFHVGSKGDNLSGGQKQKLALARTLLKRSPILILDEATASLDNNSQTRIQRYITSKLKGKTTVIAILHRLDMISEYDHILVMQEGKISESGTYGDLIDRKGTLYDLINGGQS